MFYGVAQTSDMGFIFAGSARSDTTVDNDKLWLLKTDSLGDASWDRRFRPLGCEAARAHSVIQTSDGGYAIAGYVFIDSGPATTRTFVLRTDDQGDSLWAKCYGGRTSIARDIEPTRDGGYVVAGEDYTVSNGSWRRDVYVVRLDSLGDSLWSLKLGDSALSDRALAVKETPDGGFVVAANRDENGECSAWMIRLDSAGHVRWAPTIFARSTLSGVSIGLDGDLTFSGTTVQGGAGSSDYLLLRTDSAGRRRWHRTYGGPETDASMAMAPCNDGGYVITGQSWSFGHGTCDAWTVRTDSQGIVMWSQAYGGSSLDDGRSVAQTSDGGIIIAGITTDTGYSNDGYAVRTDENGSSSLVEGRGRPSQQPCEKPMIEALLPGRLRFWLPADGKASVSIVDASGRVRAKRDSRQFRKGWHELGISSDLPSGSYFAVLTAGGRTVSCKTFVVTQAWSAERRAQ
jgi:hypothetical protein